MKWLSFSEAQNAMNNSRLDPQTVMLFSHLTDLDRSIPAAPRLVSTTEGVPCQIREWYGQIGDRVLLVQSDNDPGGAVTVVTPFLDSSTGSGDWNILHELYQLPACIFVSRPLYIESRTSETNHVVFRRDPRGWQDPVYRAASQEEARNLLEYLQRDNWNGECFIGEAEPAGRWAIVEEEMGESRTIGAYTEKSAALKFAYRISLQKPHLILHVRPLFKAHNIGEYRIVRGQIFDR